jgi:hypothetical protein
MTLAVAALDDPRDGALGLVIERVAARAVELDGAPRFPIENLRELRDAGALQVSAGQPLAEQIAIVRAVAGADASTARILDGHVNGAERLLTCAPGSVDRDELEAIASGALLSGVWGADPVAGEGPPARIEPAGDGRSVLRGVKVFCSGAGGVHRPLVVARDAAGDRRLVLVDATPTGLEVDRDWYRGSGLRSSESHRVVFADTPVLAVLGGANELARQPWFARDGVRTSATWAGLCDALAQLTLAAVGASAEADAHQDAALGLIDVHRDTAELWLAHAARRLERPGIGAARAAEVATRTRAALTAAGRVILDCSSRACGSRGLAGSPRLGLARRDLDIFLLQHRLEPQLESLGRAARGAAG